MRAITVIATLLVTSGAAQSDTFADVMRRAHEYVVVYEDHELSSVIASEHYYEQRLDRIGQLQIDRALRSDYLIFQLPPQEDWFALRDVYEGDGMPVGDHAARFRQLFTGPRETVTDRAMAGRSSPLVCWLLPESPCAGNGRRHASHRRCLPAEAHRFQARRRDLPCHDPFLSLRWRVEMSFAAARESNEVRNACESCRDRPPSINKLRQGAVLCFECHRTEVNRRRAERLQTVPSAVPLPPFFSGARKLTSAEIAHRRQMLGYLRRSRGL